MTTKHELFRAIDELSEDQLRSVMRIVERMRENGSEIKGKADLSRYRGVLRLSEDPLLYQERSRNEWS